MRRKEQQISDRNIIDKILSNAEVVRLGFIDGDRPYIVPFNYGYSDNCIYIHCAPEGRKIDLIKENPLVCIEAEQTAEIERYEKACQWGTIYRSVIGWGMAEIITDYQMKRDALDIIMSHYGAGETHNLDYDKRKVDNMSVIKVVITEITGKQSGNWEER